LAKKQRKSEIKHRPTSRQLSKWERQKKTQRIVLITGLSFIIVVLGFIGYGYYDSAIRPFQQPVLEVNSTTYDMDYYLKILGVYLQGADYARGVQISSMISNKMINDAIVIQKSSQLGVTLTEKELNEEIATLKIPDDKAYRSMIEADALTQKVLKDYFGAKVPISVDQADIRAIFVDSEYSANEAISLVAGSDNFTSISDRFNVDSVVKKTKGQMGWLPKGYINTLLNYPKEGKLDEIAFKLNKGETSQPIYDPSIIKGSGYWILKVMEKDEDISRRTSGIFVGTLNEAMEIKKRLENGEDFSSLVKQISQDPSSKENNGDLGWLHKDYGNDAINNAAFSLDSGKISLPIRDNARESKGGYWVVKVIDKETNKDLSSTFHEAIIQTQFQNWVDEQKKTSMIKEYLNEQEKLQIVDTILNASKNKK
jgi:parvulin-like peptidyl-prolyl isomerase